MEEVEKVESVPSSAGVSTKDSSEKSLREKVASALRSSARRGPEFFTDSSIPILERPPTALQFCRDFVSANRPVLIKNAINHWPALFSWSDSQYLVDRMGDSQITVAVTPNGLADAITDIPDTTQRCFALPEYRRSTLKQVLAHLREEREHFEELKYGQTEESIEVIDDSRVQESESESVSGSESSRMALATKCPLVCSATHCQFCNEVWYCQRQNGCLLSEFSALSSDVDLDLKWAHDAFDAKPDAVNFWLGNGRSNSSCHSDPFENIYCVVEGTKLFTLYSPFDAPNIPKVELEKRQWHFDASAKRWQLQRCLSADGSVETVHWCDLDACDLSKATTRLQVAVEAGDVLYLPRLWFHSVGQREDVRGRVVAVNLWYDMKFDALWSCTRLIQELIGCLKQEQVADTESLEEKDAK